jgi:ATP-binding cassette subfamily B protein
VFDNVRFAYNDFATEPILKGVSFTIEPNTTTAIVGATGAGKSSIINVLMRFYDLTAGTITLNGVPIDRYRLETLRCSMGLVMQDVFLFSGSIYENITLGDNSVPLARVEEAAKQIGVHRFIEQLPGGYQFQVGERGGALSTGQRQLISFLRVMIADPQVLLMDEATSNIDSETEHLVQQAINTLLTKRTAIIIAHRLSTIQRADQIIVLHKGNIVEKGSHQQLLALNGYYKKLYLLQYGKAVEA